jgi:hypothetical protein
MKVNVDKYSYVETNISVRTQTLRCRRRAAFATRAASEKFRSDVPGRPYGCPPPNEATGNVPRGTPHTVPFSFDCRVPLQSPGASQSLDDLGPSRSVSRHPSITHHARTGTHTSTLADSSSSANDGVACQRFLKSSTKCASPTTRRQLCLPAVVLPTTNATHQQVANRRDIQRPYGTHSTPLTGLAGTGYLDMMLVGCIDLPLRRVCPVVLTRTTHATPQQFASRRDSQRNHSTPLKDSAETGYREARTVMMLVGCIDLLAPRRDGQLCLTACRAARISYPSSICSCWIPSSSRLTWPCLDENPPFLLTPLSSCQVVNSPVSSSAGGRKARPQPTNLHFFSRPTVPAKVQLAILQKNHGGKTRHNGRVCPSPVHPIDVFLSKFHIAADLSRCLFLRQGYEQKRAKGTMVQYKLAAAALLSLSATKAYVKVSSSCSLGLHARLWEVMGFPPRRVGTRSIRPS